MRCETIKVVNGDGFMIINKSDFDPKVHTEYGTKPSPKPEKKPRKSGKLTFGRE